MRPGRQQRQGLTLVELLVAIAILGVMAGLSMSALRAVPLPAAAAPRRAAAATARRRALETGRLQVIRYVDSTGAHLLTAQPDGSVIGGGVSIDRLSGRGDAPR